MSYADTLTVAQHARFTRALDEAASILAAARAERDRLAMTGGPEAVAEAAGHQGERAAEVAEHYRRLQDRARQKAAA